MGPIRARSPQVRIVLRTDSGFARMALKSWCECREVDHVFGLARNPRLVRESAIELGPARATSKETGKPAKCFEEFRYRTLDSWSCERRVVGKAEQLAGDNGEPSLNPRFVVACLAAVAWPAASCRGGGGQRLDPCHCPVETGTSSAPSGGTAPMVHASAGQVVQVHVPGGMALAGS